jgi:hypothetical protein
MLEMGLGSLGMLAKSLKTIQIGPKVPEVLDFFSMGGSHVKMESLEQVVVSYGPKNRSSEFHLYNIPNTTKVVLNACPDAEPELELVEVDYLEDVIVCPSIMFGFYPTRNWKNLSEHIENNIPFTFPLVTTSPCDDQAGLEPATAISITSHNQPPVENDSYHESEEVDLSFNVPVEEYEDVLPPWKAPAHSTVIASDSSYDSGNDSPATLSDESDSEEVDLSFNVPVEEYENTFPSWKVPTDSTVIASDSSYDSGNDPQVTLSDESDSEEDEDMFPSVKVPTHKETRIADHHEFTGRRESMPRTTQNSGNGSGAASAESLDSGVSMSEASDSELETQTQDESAVGSEENCVCRNKGSPDSSQLSRSAPQLTEVSSVQVPRARIAKFDEEDSSEEDSEESSEETSDVSEFSSGEEFLESLAKMQHSVSRPRTSQMASRPFANSPSEPTSRFISKTTPRLKLPFKRASMPELESDVKPEGRISGPKIVSPIKTSKKARALHESLKQSSLALNRPESRRSWLSSHLGVSRPIGLAA